MDVWSYLVGKAKGGGGPSPSGTIEITENGTYDVTSKATANVNVSGGGQELTISSGRSYRPGYDVTFSTIPSLTLSGNSCEYMFYGYKGSTIPRLIGTSNATNMDYMFYDCVNTTNFNLSNYNTSNVTSMNYMFYCGSGVAIKNLDCSSFDTSKVKYMSYIFNLPQLAVLDISSWDFSSVTEAYNPFGTTGNYSSTSDGAYANGVPYVYVKDATAQAWVLEKKNTWTTDNVVIKS